MLRILPLVMLCLTGIANAQTTGVGSVATSPSAYSGLGDVVASASVYYSCARAYSAAYAAGNGKACQLRRVFTFQTTLSNSAGRCDILLATNGTLGVTANCDAGGDNGLSVSQFCNIPLGTYCTVSKMYDQSGNSRDVISGNNPNQEPHLITYPAQNGSPFINCVGCIWSWQRTTFVLDFGPGANIAQPLSFSAVLVPSDTVTTHFNTALACGNTSVGPQMGNKAGSGAYVAASVSTGFGSMIPTNTFASIQGVFNSSSSLIDVNGTVTSSLNPGTDGCTTAALHITILGDNGAPTDTFVGLLAEAAIYPIGFNATQYGNITTNQRNFYKF